MHRRARCVNDIQVQLTPGYRRVRSRRCGHWNPFAVSADLALTSLLQVKVVGTGRRACRGRVCELALSVRKASRSTAFTRLDRGVEYPPAEDRERDYASSRETGGFGPLQADETEQPSRSGRQTSRQSSRARVATTARLCRPTPSSNCSGVRIRHATPLKAPATHISSLRRALGEARSDAGDGLGPRRERG